MNFPQAEKIMKTYSRICSNQYDLSRILGGDGAQPHTP